MRPGLRRAVLLAALWPLACGGGDRGSPAAPAASAALALRLETAHFRIYADAVPEAVLQEVAAALERELPRFQADLQVAAIRTLTVRVFQDEAAWYGEVQRYFGRRIETSGYVTGPEELRVLAGSRVARNASHELAHCVSLYTNPTIANNPRWLWESVALYENGELVDPRTLPYMVAATPPTLAELDADVTASRRVYEVGYTIGEFVVARDGQAALVRLVRANGDTAAVLGLTPAAFEEAWFGFVRERYLASAASIAWRSSGASGGTLLLKNWRTVPSLATRYLAKFQVGSDPVLPRTP